MRKSALMTKMGSIIIVSRCVYIPSRTPWQMLFAVIQIYDRWVWKIAWMSNYSSFASSKMSMILIGWSRNSRGAQVYLISFYNRQKHTVLCQTPWCSSSTSRSQFKWLSFLKTIQAAAYERPDRNCVSASHGGRREPHLSLRGWDTACSVETKQITLQLLWSIFAQWYWTFSSSHSLEHCKHTVIALTFTNYGQSEKEAAISALKLRQATIPIHQQEFG